MIDPIITPIPFVASRLPTPTEAGARLGYVVWPCSRLMPLCGRLNFRTITEGPLLVCSCGAPTIQPGGEPR